MSQPLVIIGCGKTKRPHPAPALDLYVGSYYRKVLTYARTLTPDHRIVVLSGKYGLVRHDKILAPYDQRMGQPGAIRPDQDKTQAHLLGLTRELDVVALVGETGGYARIVRDIWPHARFPLAGVGGMGARLQWLTRQVA